MAKPGPKGKTDAEKRARGTAQKCRTGKVVQMFDLIENREDLPEPPDWFSRMEPDWPPKKYAIALTTFEENRDRLFKEGRLAERHIEGLLNYAVLQSEFIYSASKGSVSSSLVSQITTLQKSLGILPDGKATTASLEKPKGSRFTNNGRQARSNARR